MLKLSKQQINILLHLYRLHCEELADVEAGRRPGFAATRWPFWGVKWNTSGGDRSSEASISRALLRLEQRGLVLRQNEISGMPEGGRIPGHRRESKADPHNRATHVVVLPEGLEVAKRLTPKVESEC